MNEEEHEFKINCLMYATDDIFIYLNKDDIHEKYINRKSANSKRNIFCALRLRDTINTHSSVFM